MKRLMVIVLFFMAGRAGAQRYPFFNLGIEQGLIQSQATSLAQDAEGHLWIGTLGGLSRYDGQSFSSYTVRDGLPENPINDLEIDKTGMLWIGTSHGLTAYDGHHFHFHPVRQDINNTGAGVNSLSCTMDGSVWFISDGKAYHLKDNVITQIQIPEKDKRVTALWATANGDLWMGLNSDDKIYHFYDGRWMSLALPREVLSRMPFIHRFFQDRNGTIWLLSSDGLYVVQGDHIVMPDLSHIHSGRALISPGMPPITSMTQLPDGSYWLTTNMGGALHFTDTTIVRYSKHSGLADNTINDLLTDKEGNLWLASDGLGLFRFSGAPFISLDESLGLPSAQIMSLALDNSGGLFLGTYDAGLYRYRNNKVTYLPLPADIKPAIISLAIVGGDVWIGTRGYGLFRYHNGSYRNYSMYNSQLPSNFVASMHQDTTGKLWIGFVNGAVIFDKEKFTLLPRRLSVDDFKEIGKDSMLLATAEGNMLYTAGKEIHFLTGRAPDSAVPECYALRGTELWIGTSDNGVICYDLRTKNTSVINGSNGLRSDFVYNLVVDREGNIWAGTGFGIHRISGSNGSFSVTHFGQSQGVTGMESNHNAVEMAPDGSIWFGTTNGALHYEPHGHVAAAQPVSIILQSVRLYGESITDTSYFKKTSAFYSVPLGLRLPYQKNNLSFTFRAVSLSGQDRVLYRYRIEGLDDGWTDWGPTSTVNYPALPPGKYVFRVQCTTDGLHPVRELGYPFEIVTPFHKTVWFRWTIIALCILLGVSLQYAANRRKHNRREQLEQLRREEQSKVRQRTAEDFHDEVGNKLTRINVLTNVLRRKLEPDAAESHRILEQIQDNAGQLYSGTRDILWSLKPSSDNLYEILHRIRDFGGDLFGDTDIQFQFEGTDEIWKNFRLPMDQSRNLIMIFKEGMNNVLKHSEATKVILKAKLDQDVLSMTLSDDGQGFDPDHVKKGHGIDNMMVRAGRIGGTLTVDSVCGQGTKTELMFKIPSIRGASVSIKK